MVQLNGGAFAGDLLTQFAAFDPTLTPAADAAAALIESGEKYKVTSTAPENNEGDALGLTLKLDWNISDSLSLTSITGYREVDQTSITSATVPTPPLTGVGTDNLLEQEQLSQEFLLNWTVNDNTHLLAGLFYFEEEGVDENLLPERALAWAALGAPLPGGFPISIQLRGDDIKNTALGVFASATVDLSDAWSVQAGVRYTEEEKEVFVDSFLDLSFVGAGQVPLAIGHEEFDDEVTTYDMKLIWTPRDDLMTYAKFSTGYRAGGIGFRAANASFEPEEIDSWELGLKSDFQIGDMPVRANLAAYYNEYVDFQLPIVLRNPTRQTVTNAGEATIQGLEAELLAYPTQNLALSLSVSLLDAEYDEFIVEGPSALGNGDVDLGDNELRRAPDVTLNLNVNYVVPLKNDSDLVFNLGYTYTDDYETNVVFQTGSPTTDLLGDPVALRTENFHQDGFGNVNATITWRNALTRGVDVSLWGRNLTDENIIVYSLSTAEANTVIWSEPRSYGLNFNYSF